MAGIQNHFRSMLIFSRLKLQLSRPSTLLQLPTRESNIIFSSGTICSTHSQKAQALSNSALLLGLTSSSVPAPNITIFIVTSASLFTLFWLVNFLVPDIVTKNLQAMKEREQQKSEENTILTGLEEFEKRALDKAQKNK